MQWKRRGESPTTTNFVRKFLRLVQFVKTPKCMIFAVTSIDTINEYRNNKEMAKVLFLYLLFYI